MPESTDQPAAPVSDFPVVAPEAVRNLIKGLVGIGVTPAQLAAFEQGLFSDIWKHEMHTFFPRLDHILEGKFREAIERRVNKLIAD